MFGNYFTYADYIMNLKSKFDFLVPMLAILIVPMFEEYKTGKVSSNFADKFSRAI